MFVYELLEEIGEVKIKQLIKAKYMSSTVLMQREVFLRFKNKECKRTLQTYSDISQDMKISVTSVRDAIRSLEQCVK